MTATLQASTDADEMSTASRVTQLIDELPDAGWLMCWAIDPVGDCACPRRSTCPRPGKHPYQVAFEHGALDAVSTRAEAEQHRFRQTRLGIVPGGHLIILDLDGPRQWAAFVRHVADYVDAEHLVAVAKTTRGWHIYLWAEADGWTMGALGAWMRSWLRRKDLYGIEYRTGTGSYVLYPEGLDNRRWVPLSEFAERVDQTSRRLPPIKLAESWGAPWLRAEDEALTAHFSINSPDNSDLDPDDTDIDPETAHARLRRACDRLAKVQEGNRNNRLNQVAYYQGALAVASGVDEQTVVDLLTAAAVNNGTSGIDATIRSGLRAGRTRHHG